MSILLASQYASRGNVSQFTRIIQKDPEYYLSDHWSLHSAATLALVLFPETLDSFYELLIHQIFTGTLERGGADIPEEPINLPEREIESRKESLIEYLSKQSEKLGWSRAITERQEGGKLDAYSRWIQVRTRRVDECCGVIPQFKYSPELLASWVSGIADVVSEYRQYYSGWFTISEFENRDSRKNVFQLLENTSPSVTARDIRTLVIPYVTYIDDWSGLYWWIEQNVNNLDILLPLANIKSISNAVIAACYLSQNTDQASISTLKRIQKAIPVSSGYPKNDRDYTIFASTDFSSLTTLLQSSITARSPKALDFLNELIKAVSLLSAQFNVSLYDVAYLRLCADETEQRNVVVDYLRNCDDSYKAHEDLYWLKSPSGGIISKVPTEEIDASLIEASLSNGAFDFIRKFYPHPPLHLVIKTFDYFYDNATNGNKTRGKMKTAASCLELSVNSEEQDSIELEKRKALLYATHELSQFSLTLTPGVPLQPLEIKQHASDPLYIIHRVLELNPDACKELSLLTVIAESLIQFTGEAEVFNHPVDTVPVRVCAMCVQAALIDTNFPLAYQYAMTLSSLKDSSVAWTACFQVGKFISPDWDSARPPNSVLRSQLDILSRTLTICPQENIASVLSTWKKNEQLLEPKSAQESFSPSSRDRTNNNGSDGGGNNTSSNSQGDRKRDQISNLLVSGLGWAIGAN